MSNEINNEPNMEENEVNHVAQPASTSFTEQNNPQPTSSKKWVWIALGGLLLLLVIGLGWGTITKNKEDAMWQDAQQAAENGDWALVVETISEQLAIQPAFLQSYTAEALGLRGVARTHLGETDAALADLNEAIAADENLIDLYAYRALLQKDTETAKTDAETAVSNNLLPAHLAAQMQFVLVDTSDSNTIDAVLAESDLLTDTQLAELYLAQLENYLAVEDEDAQLELIATVSAQQFEVSPANQAALHTAIAKLALAANENDIAFAHTAAALTLAEHLDEASIANLHRAQAGLYLIQGDLEKAISEAELANYDALIHALQGWAAYLAFDNETAVAEAETALETAAEESTAARIAYLTLGAVATWQGAFQRANESLDKAIAIKACDVEARALRIYNYLNLFQYDAAAADVNYLIEHAPYKPASLWAQAEFAMSQRDYELSNVLIDQALAQDDTRPEYFVSLAKSYSLTEDEQRELDDIAKALTLNPDFAPAITFDAIVRFSQNEIDNYDEIAQQMIDQYPEWSLGENMMAEYFYYTLGDSEEALRWINEAIEINPDFIFNYLTRADINYWNGEYDAAQADYEYVLTFNPDYFRAKTGLANIIGSQEGSDQTIETFEELHAAYPRSLKAYGELAGTYLDAGETEKAWTLTQELLTIDPLFVQGRLLSAYLYLEQDTPQKALSEVEKALVIEPFHAYAHALKASLLVELGDSDGAISSAEEAIAINPLMAEPHRVLIWNAILNEDYEEAEAQLALWQEKLRFNETTAETISFYQLNLGLNEETIETITTAIEEDSDLDAVALASLYYNRALANLNIDEKEAGEEDLLQVIELSEDINVIADAEAILADSKQVVSVGNGRLQYTNDSFGYAFTYADWWQKIPSENVDQDIDALLLHEDDESFGIAYTILFIEDLTAAQVAATIEQESVRSNFTVISSEPANISDIDSYVVRYDLDTDFITEGKLYIFVQDRYIVQLFLETDANSFAELEAELDQMAETFTFLP
mgnify:CR=1 FL=1